jgi:hypothetical protein
MTAAPTVTVRAPFAIRKRGGRKVIVTPDGAAAPPPEARPPRIDNALVKALARAFRWRRMLESGDYGSIADLARAEKIGRSYVSAMLGLTLLAPDIVEAILDGRQPLGVTLEALTTGVPLVWGKQAGSEPRAADFTRGHYRRIRG